MTKQAGEALDLSDRSIYAHWTSMTLRFSDEDSMGHVNNAAYLVYFEAARVLFLDQFLDREAGEETVLARITVDFLRETRFPGTLEIGARLTGLGSKSLRSAYGIFRDGQCLATAECVNVFFDIQRRRSTHPPSHVRTAIESTLASQR
jgi:acyl-CoA thioester hydrolase